MEKSPMLLGVLTMAALSACETPTPDANDFTGDKADEGACSQDYWSWMLEEFVPLLERPLSEVSLNDLAQAVAASPDAANDLTAYEVCWQPWFFKFVYAPAMLRIQEAHTSFTDEQSEAFHDLGAYRASSAAPPEVLRNAAALMLVRPEETTRLGYGDWLSAYSDVLDLSVRTVGLIGLNEYYDILEDEWVINESEAEYLALFEAARPKVVGDGALSLWLDNYQSWLFGPPMLSGSFVFNAPWYTGRNSDYGQGGIELSLSGEVTIPAVVRDVVDRLDRVRPDAGGPSDGGHWMSQYNARVLRAWSDHFRGESFLDQANELALELYENNQPIILRGNAFNYERWLATLSVVSSESDWRERVMNTQPCLDGPDELDAATDLFTRFNAEGTHGSISAPVECS